MLYLCLGSSKCRAGQSQSILIGKRLQSGRVPCIAQGQDDRLTCEQPGLLLAQVGEQKDLEPSSGALPCQSSDTLPQTFSRELQKAARENHSRNDGLYGSSQKASINGCGSTNRYQNGTLVSGNMDQNLRNPSWSILSHAHMEPSLQRGPSSFQVSLEGKSLNRRACSCAPHSGSLASRGRLFTQENPPPPREKFAGR